jgi:hypothetical protein
MLNEYKIQTQRFIRDQEQRLLNPRDLEDYVNRSRKEIAMRTQSIRILTPVEGSISTIEVTDPGAGYVTPLVRISWPDSPSGQQPNPGGRLATAVASQLGGQISNVSLNDGGDGYFQPEVFIYDQDPLIDEQMRQGTNPAFRFARARAYTVPILVTQGMQEVYPFSAVPLTRYPGVGEIFAVKSISFIYMNYRYSIPVFNFSVYQAYVRIYPQQYLYVPTAAAQFGQGVNGSLYMYPIPSTIYQMEWDVFCLPTDLEDDLSFEAIPKPWTEAVPYFAAHLAFLELQNLNSAKFYLDLYDNMVHRYSAYARPGRAVNPYGRWAAFT